MEPLGWVGCGFSLQEHRKGLLLSRAVGNMESETAKGTAEQLPGAPWPGIGTGVVGSPPFTAAAPAGCRDRNQANSGCDG
jgi:hypothetical protein